MSISSQLREIAAASSENRYSLYEKLADQLIQHKNSPALIELVQHLVSREGSDTYGRTYIVGSLLVHVVMTLEDADKKLAEPMDLDALTPLLVKFVDIIRPRADDYSDALMHGLRVLSECYHANGEIRQAASTLASFNFDEYVGKCTASVEIKIRWLVDCAESYLDKAVSDPGRANQQIKKAHALINELNQHINKLDKQIKATSKPPSRDVTTLHEMKALQFRFRTVYARVLDQERKFLEAAMRYMELSQTGQGFASDDDLLKALELAVTCAILAKAGGPRSRVLAMLYSDSRAKHLSNFTLLEKMFKERIIRAGEVRDFEKMLEVHQNADTSTGRTVLQNSVIEHNLLAASKLYHNIRFDELGVLLNIKSAAAEQLASTMIEQGRLRAKIDQVQLLLEFLHDGVGSSKGSSGTSGASGVFGEFDAAIEDFCVTIGRVTDGIQAMHPQYN